MKLNLKNILGIGIMILVSACTESKLDLSNANLPNLPKENNDPKQKVCKYTPTESIGKHPIISAENLVRSDISEGKEGVKLDLNLTIFHKGKALKNANVDLWHCDAKGNYSQYGEFKNSNFLRGRQITNSDGKVSFVTIFPGWHKNRAGHIYVYIKSADGKFLKTQIAFPQEIQNKVYKSENYNGLADTTNKNDKAFSDSLNCNLPDEINGDVENGYKLIKKIVIE